MNLRPFLCVICAAIAPQFAWAQGANISFGGEGHDSSQPVEIASEQLEIDQESGFAVFTGDVVVVQDDLRLAAPRVEVEYEDNGGDVQLVRALGGVILTSPEEVAESQTAVYTPSDSTMVMTDDVVITQGRNAIAGDNAVLNLDAGTGVVTGNVRVIFQQDDN